MDGATLGHFQCYTQESFVLRNIDTKKMFELIDKYDVTHFGGAPIVLNMIVNTPKEYQKKLKKNSERFNGRRTTTKYYF